MKAKTHNIHNYILLALIACLVLIPFIWMLSTALKTESEALSVPPLLFPKIPQFTNFIMALTVAPFLNYLFNTVVVACFVVILSTAVTVLASFAFSWMEFPGKDVLFFIVLGSMMIPQEMLIITNFMTIAKLGWMNTYQALVLPYGVNAFNIFLLRQTMKQIPTDLFTAARIDGLSFFRFLRKVVLPICKPTVLTTMLLSLIWVWNTFAWPNLITTKDSLRMVSNGLSNAFTTNSGTIRYELQMSAATLVTIPLIVLFVFLRKNIFAGIQSGGIKG
ncbi:MAG: ABC transporter permease [Spirochaetae bacterium HGW-Spirochaetae-8]|nr:MAG: ABC transporter permease [Spirochaetae bacterium HGW-Spirochaetae-8]